MTEFMGEVPKGIHSKVVVQRFLRFLREFTFKQARTIIFSDSLDQIAQLPQVSPDGGPNKIGNACVAVLSTGYDLLNFLG